MAKNKGTEGIRRQAQELIDQAYERGFKAGKGEVDETLDKAYQRGLDDAWECARKMVCDVAHGGMSADQLYCVLGTSIYHEMFNFHASEAIARIKAYEEQKKAESKAVNVGDEVVFDGGKGVVIDEISDDEVYILNDLGCVEKMERRLIVKTGRLCLSIERIVKQLQECKE